MIYLSLPLLYENKLFNNYIDQFISLNPDKAKIPMKIEYLHGSYPWSLWNGGSNSNYGNAVLYNEMQDIVKNTSSPHAVDCSNIYLNDSDLSDIHQNIILEIESNTGAAFEVSDLKLYNYIKDHYPDAEFIFSNKAELFNTFNEDIVEAIINNDDFNLIVLSDPMPNINKNKVSLLVSQKCYNCTRQKQLDCISAEQRNQYNFSGKTVYQNCNKLIYNQDFFAEMRLLSKEGYTHFWLGTPPSDINLLAFNINIIHNLIKPAYVVECITKFLNMERK